MTLAQIKAAVESGQRVFWVHAGYEVIKDNIGQWLIICHANQYCTGLTWQDGETVNGEPDQFFTSGKAEQSKTAFAFHVCDQNTLKDLLTASRAEVNRLTLAVENLEGINTHCKM